MMNNRAMITYIRPSGNEIIVAKGEGAKAYAEANGWKAKKDPTKKKPVKQAE